MIGDINEYHREGRLREIPGVGKSIGELIAELLETGTSPFYESLKKETPPELFDIINVPGIGRRTAIKVHKALGVTTLEEFSQAAKNHRIRNIKGFGDRAEKKILDSIVRFKRVEAETRIPIFRALGVAAELRSYLERLRRHGTPGCRRQCTAPGRDGRGRQPSRGLVEPEGSHRLFLQFSCQPCD